MTDNLLVLDNGLGVRTYPDMNAVVKLTVETGIAGPESDYTGWQRVNECSIHILSGPLYVSYWGWNIMDAKAIPVSSGDYRARTYYGGPDFEEQSSLDTGFGLAGNSMPLIDTYKIALWHQDYADIVVRKAPGHHIPTPLPPHFPSSGGMNRT